MLIHKGVDYYILSQYPDWRKIWHKDNSRGVYESAKANNKIANVGARESKDAKINEVPGEQNKLSFLMSGRPGKIGKHWVNTAKYPNVATQCWRQGQEGPWK